MSLAEFGERINAIHNDATSYNRMHVSNKCYVAKPSRDPMQEHKMTNRNEKVAN